MSLPVSSALVENKSKSSLVRELGTIDATMIVIGSMIGSGIFIVSAESARLVGAPGWLLLAWALAGLMTVSGSICAAEIAAMMPRVGGQYVFLREAYRPMFGFLFGWAMFLVVQTGTIAAVSVAFAKFLGVFTPLVAADRYLVPPIRLGGFAVSLSTQQIVAIALIAVLTAVNTQGLKLGKWIQNTFTFTKTAALVGLIVVGLALGSNFGSAAWTSSWWSPAANGWNSASAFAGLPVEGWAALPMLLGLAMIGPLFAQSAWNNVTFTGGEVRDPGRTFPKAMIIGTSSVVLLYLLANVAYTLTLPFAGIQNAPQDRVGTAAMQAILGPPGAAVMAGAILISTFGCVNGLVLAGARVYYAMACDGLFFRRVATTNRWHVPATALLAQGIWASILVLPVTVTPDDRGLRVMSSVADVNGIPTEGKNSVIVAAVGNVLHFRAFDDDARMVVDTDETRLTGQVQQIETLRKQLAGPLDELTRSAVFTAATSIVGYTPVKYGNLYNELLEYIIPVDVTFYMLMVGAVVAFRRKAPGLDRPYRTIGYPLPALIYISLALLLIVDFIYLKPRTSGKGYLIVLAGIPVYVFWVALGPSARDRRDDRTMSTER